MYRLPQAGILANKLLQKQLAVHGYVPTEYTPGLWMHHTRPVLFSLVVDDFGIQYVGKHHANHLFHVLEENNKAACDWEGRLYCGVTLDWDYQQRTSTFLCQGTLQLPSTSTNMPPQNNIATVPPIGPPHNTAPKCN